MPFGHGAWTPLSRGENDRQRACRSHFVLDQTGLKWYESVTLEEVALGTSVAAIIDVIHELNGSWHKFTSPQVPGFYLVAEQNDLERAYDDIPRSIEALILHDRQERVSVRPEKTYSEYLASLPETHKPAIRHYSVEKIAA